MSHKPPTYAMAGGPPDDWNQLLVKFNGEYHDEFIEVNVTEGWGFRYKRDEAGKLVLIGDNLMTERVEGVLELEYRK